MLRILPLSVLCFAAVACTDGSGDYPRLLPTEQILAEPALPDHAGPATSSADPVRDTVEAQGAATRSRADAIPDPVDDGALAARAADLRRRAEALRNQTDAPPDCPADATTPDCPQPAD